MQDQLFALQKTNEMKRKDMAKRKRYTPPRFRRVSAALTMSDAARQMASLCVVASAFIVALYGVFS